MLKYHWTSDLGTDRTEHVKATRYPSRQETRAGTAVTTGASENDIESLSRNFEYAICPRKWIEASSRRPTHLTTLGDVTLSPSKNNKK